MCASRKSYHLYLPPIHIKRNEKGQFIKGHVPCNKNKKGLRHSPGTEFKKGNLPANTKYNGCISLRKKQNGERYYYIRISKAKWVPYHRHLWEQKNGKIPGEMLIIFKDKNSLNCKLENLKMVSKCENLKRNLNRKKMQQSMKKTWKFEKLRVHYGREQQTKLRISK